MAINKKEEKSLISKIQEMENARDGLSDKLALIEDKTKAAAKWVTNNEHSIAKGYHQLIEAFNEGNGPKTLSLLNDLGDIAGIILEIPVIKGNNEPSISLSQFALEKFDDSLLIKEAMDKIEKGIPSSAYSHLDNLPPAPPEPPEARKIGPDAGGFWSRISGSREKELLEKVETVKRETLQLQTETPYYIDSFFDFIESGINPDETDKYETDKDRAQLQANYKNPEYVLRLAHNDFLETISTFSSLANNIAHAYHSLSEKFQNADINASAKLKEISEDYDFAKRVKEWVLEDNNIVSFAQFSLKHFDNKANLASTLSDILKQEKDFTLAQGHKYTDNFSELMTLALDKNDPLPSYIITEYLGHLRYEIHDDNTNCYTLVSGSLTDDSSALSRALDTYRDNENQLSELLGALLEGIKVENTQALSENYASLINGLDNNDINKVLSVFEDAELSNVLALAKIIEPEFSILDKIFECFSDRDDQSKAFITALENGVPLELTDHNVYETLNFITEEVLKDPTDKQQPPLPMESLRASLAYIKETKGLSALWEIAQSGYVSSNLNKIGDEIELQEDFLTSVLEFFPNNIYHANILRSNADKIENYKDKLTDLAESASGHFVRYKDTGLFNPDKIANIWYDGKTLRYISNGATRPVSGSIDENSAWLVLDNIVKQNDNYLSIAHELLNTDLIDYLWLTGDNPEDQQLRFFAQDKESYVDTNITEATEALDTFQDLDNYLSTEHYLFNKDSISYLLKMDDALHYFHGEASNPLPLSETESSDLFKELEKDDRFLCLGDHLINLDQLSFIWENDHEQTISFLTKGIVYDSEHYEGLPEIKFTPEELEEVLNKIDNNDNLVRIGNKVINLNNIDTISYDGISSTLSFKIDEHSFDVEINSQDKTTLLNTLSEGDQFIKMGPLVSFANINQVTNAWYNAENDTAVFLCGKEKYDFQINSSDWKHISNVLGNKNFIDCNGESINPEKAVEVWYEPNNTTALSVFNGKTVSPIYMTDKTANRSLDQIEDYGRKNFMNIDKDIYEFTRKLNNTVKEGHLFNTDRMDKLPTADKTLDALLVLTQASNDNDEKGLEKDGLSKSFDSSSNNNGTNIEEDPHSRPKRTIPKGPRNIGFR